MKRLSVVFLLIFLLGVTSGCALQFRQQDITETDITDEETTPEPPSDDFAPLEPSEPAEPSEDITDFLDDEMGEEPLPPEPPAPPEPEPDPEIGLPPPPVDDWPPPSLDHQGPLDPPETSRINAALAPNGASSRQRAALALTAEGRELAATSNIYLAEKRFERALSVDPSCGQAYLALAELRFDQERWREASDLATKAALRLSSDAYFLSRAHLLAAKAYVNDNNLRQAYQQILFAVEADPGNLHAQQLRLRLERRLGVR